MKRFGAAALAAVAAFAVIAPLPALADGFYGPRPYYPPPPRYYHDYDHHHGNGDLVAAGALGLIGGAVLAGALMQPAPPPPPVPVYVQPAPVPVYTGPVVATPHVAWCQARYRSYNPYNNTWVDSWGRMRVCTSPYG